MNTDDISLLALEPPKAVTELKVLPEYRRVIEVLRKLSVTQRLYLDCLVDSELDPEAARKLLKERHGIGVQRKTVERKWMRGNADFAEAVTAMQDFLLSGLPLSKAGILARLNRLADVCGKVISYTDKAGNAFDRAVDASAAHAALVSLAKTTGILAEVADKPAAVRQINFIVQTTGPATIRSTETVDAEFTVKEKP